jgi:hypothetical protein
MRRLALINLVGALSSVTACSPEPRPRPPIDAAAPAKVETATFALG